HNRYSEHNKLNLRSRDNDKTHNPEPLEERGNALETGRGLNPARAGNIVPNLLAIKGEGSLLRAGRRSVAVQSR
ncbi:MAG: hypothetical protein ACP5KB_04795, partial [Thermoprotei archaeon]